MRFAFVPLLLALCIANDSVAAAIENFVFEDAWGPNLIFANDQDRATAFSQHLENAVTDWMRRHPEAVRHISSRDRYGRDVGDYVDGPNSLRAAMIGMGLLIADGPADPAEIEARTNQTGMWSVNNWPLCHQNSGEATQGLSLVTGKVRQAQLVGRTLYLNFGEDWRRDFTISYIRKRGDEIGDPNRFVGTWVEARGFVFWRGGPAIEVTDVQDIVPVSPIANCPQ